MGKKSTLFLSLLLLTSLFVVSPATAAEPVKIEVVAKKFAFEPARIEVKAGEPVEITFRSTDTKHGFACKELGLEKVVFTKEEELGFWEVRGYNQTARPWQVDEYGRETERYSF